jgi:hypothetical protein
MPHVNHNHSIDTQQRVLATEPAIGGRNNNQSIVTPFKSFNASNVYETGYSPYRSSFIKDLSKTKHVAQCKVRLPNGDTRAMSVEEVKRRYLETGGS